MVQVSAYTMSMCMSEYVVVCFVCVFVHMCVPVYSVICGVPLTVVGVCLHTVCI